VQVISGTSCRVAFWPFDGANFTRPNGNFDKTLPPPVQSGTSYLPFQHRVGNFSGSGADKTDEIIVPAVSATANELTLLHPVTGATVSQWVSGFGSLPELATADLGSDGFMDVLQVASDGRVFVAPGGAEPAPWANTASVATTPSGYAARKLFTKLRGSSDLDLVSLRTGAMNLDLNAGMNVNATVGGASKTVAYLDTTFMGGTFTSAPTQFAAIQAKTWTGSTPTPGPQELAVLPAKCDTTTHTVDSWTAASVYRSLCDRARVHSGIRGYG